MPNVFVIEMERLWTERSKNGCMPTFHVAVILPQIRKNFEVDEDALDEMITELDKGNISQANFAINDILKIFYFLSFQRKTD